MKFKLFATVTSVLLVTAVAPTFAVDSTAPTFSPSVRSAQSHDSIYFVMSDRFANGDTSNDNAGLPEGRFSSGFVPDEIGWWHGGDFKGIAERIDYIKKMGFTSIWITPPVQQIVFQGSSASYHGYWGLNFMTTDPHLGSESDFKAMVTAAHSAGLKVIIDVVANHTADVIQYKDNSTEYLEVSKFPYKTSTGKSFDPTLVAGKSTFPKLLANKSFAYTPLVAKFNAKIKNPSWLNDVTNYHNRGNSSFTGQSSLDGDFFGLDDLFTEKPAVVKGWIDVWSYWIKKFDIDGLRIDTFKHVNPQFWQAVIPAVQAFAKAQGKKEFPIFGEVADSDPYSLSSYIRTKQTPSVLDFGFQKEVSLFAKYGGSAASLVTLFNSDDLYTTSTTNAYQLTTFLGNHDMGRIGLQLNKAVPVDQPQTLLERAELANALLFLLRGAPVLYYGDEAGMIGTGGDKEARQDMFSTQVPEWQNETRIGISPVGTASSFDTPSVLRDQVTRLQTIIASNPALRNGVQQVRYAENGVFVITRFAQGQEYVVAFNGSDESKSAAFAVTSNNSKWDLIDGACDLSSSITVNLKARSYCVLKAQSSVANVTAPVLTLNKIVETSLTGELLQLSASVAGNDYAQVSFKARVSGGKWISVGTSDHRTFVSSTTKGGLYRVFLNPRTFKSGSKVEVVAIARSSDGQISGTKSTQLVIKY